MKTMKISNARIELLDRQRVLLELLLEKITGIDMGTVRNGK